MTDFKEEEVAQYKVYVATWNVGSRFPHNITLTYLLGLNEVEESADNPYLPDIYVLGLQEVNVQPAQQMLGFFKEDPWTEKATDLLKGYNYVCVKTEQMQGLLLMLYVRRPHILHLRDIEAEFTRTGFGGIWGNKGAVSIRFNLYGCGLSFVVAHLAAHDQHLDERIEDYKQILENHHYHVSRYREIFDHDYIWWFGDLNFRLDGDESPKKVRDAVERGEEERLLKRDQLNIVRQLTQQAFQLLQERMPAFPPTFKFKEGTSEYDMKRRPAWTDRILYAMQPINRQPNMPLEIEQCSYKSHPGYTISDHKPVSSEFTIKLFPNYRAPCVVFGDIETWFLDRENTVEYTKPLDFEERQHDWIGIFAVGYTSLRNCAAYEYVNQADSPSSDDSLHIERSDPFVNEAGTMRHRHHHHHNPERLSRLPQGDSEQVRLVFANDTELKHGQRYQLIYFQTTGLRGVTSIAGMSNEFQVVHPSRSPSPTSTDL